MPCFISVSFTWTPPRVASTRSNARLFPGRAGSAPTRGLRDLLQELLVRLRGADLVSEQLQRGAGLQRVQDPPELPHQSELLGRHQQLLLAGAGGLDVDRGEQALLGQVP